MQLGVEQAAIVAAQAPGRVIGPTLAGKTTALRARFLRICSESAQESATAICATQGAAAAFGHGATTLGEVAAELVAEHYPGTRVLSAAEQTDVVSSLLAGEGRGQWTSLAAELSHPSFAGELASTVTRYQASFLGDEELFTHAEAAGQLDRWSELADFTRRYLDHLAERATFDWAGVLVAASLLLRRPEVATPERARLGALVVDDWQLATFAWNRLLSQLAGPGGAVLIAGDPSIHVSGRMGSSPRYLEDFPRRFCAVFDGQLDELRSWPPAPEAVLADERSEAAALAGAVATTDADVVLARDDAEADRVRSLLASEGTTECRVVAVEDAVSLHWPSVVLASCRREAQPSPRPLWFDPDLFGGPDLPSDEQRRDRAMAEERRAWNLAWTRATRRIALVVLEEPGRGFQLPEGLA